jgi:hypothetical protein
MRQAQACMVAACVALGLRFAGSADQQARDVLRARLLYFIKRSKSLVGPVRAGLLFTLAHAMTVDLLHHLHHHCCCCRVQEKQDRQIVGMCINVVCLALAVVMAGTGDLDTLRIFRRLHRRVSPQVLFS